MKTYDIVLFGATSFVGKITAAYLQQQLKTVPENKGVRFAIAGRSSQKLAALKKELKDKDLASIVADSHDENSLRNMVKQAKVIISTVGPYDLYGSLLVKVCVEQGVHYCDLAGESHWVKRMIDAHGAQALQTGACIVSCCGFDSIPSDLGVHELQTAAQKQFGEPCTQIAMRVKAAKGTMSGGTVASLVNVIKLAKEDPRLRKSIASPYQICPSHAAQQQTRQKRIRSSYFDHSHQQWTAPFIMAEINTKVVHRSNALKDYAYTPAFTYSEAMWTGKGKQGRIKAYAITAGIAALALGASIQKTRSLLEKYVLPKPGQGPSKKAQEAGFYNLMFFGKTASGKSISLQCKGDRDPGYGSTAKMLAQSALCLLQDLPKEQTGGFWTPASLLGGNLTLRLEKHAGVTFKVIS